VLAADLLMINIIAHPKLRACGDASGKVLECMPTSSRFFCWDYEGASATLRHLSSLAFAPVLVSASLYQYAQIQCILVISMIS
jgi:hypothetical protein